MNIHNDKWWPPIGLILKIINLSWFYFLFHLCKQYILKTVFCFILSVFRFCILKTIQSFKKILNSPNLHPTRMPRAVLVRIFSHSRHRTSTNRGCIYILAIRSNGVYRLSSRRSRTVIGIHRIDYLWQEAKTTLKNNTNWTTIIIKLNVGTHSSLLIYFLWMLYWPFKRTSYSVGHS